jgi:glycosyltransferase involved in cell wall biosynthesis
MKIQIVTPFKMQWVSAYEKYFASLGWESSVVDSPCVMPEPDVYLLMWLDESTIDFVNSGYSDFVNSGYSGKAKKIVFIRRYEYYYDWIEKTQWDKVNAVVMLNQYLAKGFKARAGFDPYVIPNGVDCDVWTYRKRGHGNKIAWVGHVNQRKNLPLALQILNQSSDNHMGRSCQPKKKFTVGATDFKSVF